jgi:hypothetical protein
MKVLGSLRLDIKRSDSAESKLHTMASDISGSTLVALINQTTPNCQRLSIPCTGGIEMRPNATYIWQMFQYITWNHLEAIAYLSE